MNGERSYRDYGDSCALVYPPDDFEGVWIEHWPNGQLKFRGAYKQDCMRTGQHICFWENGVLREVSSWERGWVTGTLIRFYEDGTRECEREFGEHGGVTRSWTERRYHTDGELSDVNVWRDDEIVARWTRPLLREIEEEIGVDKMIDDALKKFYPDEDD